MLYTIYHYRVPGIVEARRGGTVKRVHVRSGNVVHASSSDRDDSLGAYLFRNGRLTEEQFVATMEARAGTARRYGGVLVERGLLAPAEVQQAVRGQIEWIVWSLFTWEEGAIVFDISEREEVEAIRVSLPLRQVILEGIKQVEDARALVRRMGRKDTIYEPCFQIEDLIEMGLDRQDFELLRLVDGKRSLLEICSNGPLVPADNARLLYAFHTLQLIQRGPEPGGIKVRLRSEGAGLEMLSGGGFQRATG
jgi:hypothetical protein